MNAFFHASALFRYASGTITDLDGAATEFNNSIYSYLEKKYGTLGESRKTVTSQGNAALDLKYQGWSRSRIRRGLNKLKNNKSIVQGSPICEEILYLSHRLRR